MESPELWAHIFTFWLENFFITIKKPEQNKLEQIYEEEDAYKLLHEVYAVDF